MRGSDHICRPKTKRKTSSSYNSSRPSSVSKKDSKGKVQNDTTADQSSKPTLPTLRVGASGYDVLGVVINPKKASPQLLCKTTSYDRYSESSKFSFDIGGIYEEVNIYYEEYCAHIPVLGVLGMNQAEINQDETLRAAVEQLKTTKAEAMAKIKAELVAEKKNFQQFHTPLKCLAAHDSRIDDSELLRKWTNKKGAIIEGVWVANYKTYNIDGIILLVKDKKRLIKVPVSALCDEDVAYIQTVNSEANTPRFTFRSLSVVENSAVAKRFKHAGITNMQVEAVIFGKGQNDAGEEVLFIQLYPTGQICEWPISSSRGSWRRRDVLDDEILATMDATEAAKGSVCVLEKLTVAFANAKAEKAMAKEKATKEQPFRIEYARLNGILDAALRQMERFDPRRHCEIHKWKEEFAPKFNGDAYTEQMQATYAANYMKALELQGQGKMKCTCSNEYYRSMYHEAFKLLEETRRKIDELKEAHPEIDF